MLVTETAAAEGLHQVKFSSSWPVSCLWCLWQCHKSAFLIVFLLCHLNIFFSLRFLLWILYVRSLYFCRTLSQDSFIQNQKFSWFFLEMTHKSVSAHHICHFLPHMKGHTYFPDVLKTHPCISSPHFLFPWLVSIIEALSLSWNFPCSCILTCWLFLRSCSVVQRFLFMRAAQMLIWPPNVQFSGLP